MPLACCLRSNVLYLVLIGTVVATAVEVDDSQTCRYDPAPAAGSVLLQREHSLSELPRHERSPGEHKRSSGKEFQAGKKKAGAAEPQSMFDWLWGSLEQGEQPTPGSPANLELSQRANKTKGVVTVKLKAMSRTPLSLLQRRRPSSKATTAKKKSREQDAADARVVKQKLVSHVGESRTAPSVAHAKGKPAAHVAKDKAAAVKDSDKARAIVQVAKHKSAAHLSKKDAAETTRAAKKELRMHSLEKKTAAANASPKSKLHGKSAAYVTAARAEVEPDKRKGDLKMPTTVRAAKKKHHPALHHKLMEVSAPSKTAAVTLKEKSDNAFKNGKADKAVNTKESGAKKLEKAMKDAEKVEKAMKYADEEKGRNKNAVAQKKGVDSRRSKQRGNLAKHEAKLIETSTLLSRASSAAKKAGQDGRTPESFDDSSSQTTLTGESAPLTEEGYQTLAETMDPGEMEIFVRRVCDKLSLRVVDSQGLRELVPRYDGERETQNYDALEAELQRMEGQEDSWLEIDLKGEDGKPVKGHNAPLSKSGYFAVAKLKSKEEMTEYTKRLITDLGFKVNDEGKLGGMVEWYDGKKVTQSFDALKSEIQRTAKKQNSWIVKN